MTDSTTAVGESMLAHGLHVAMLLLGLWGLAVLLVPQALERRRSSSLPAAHDDHARRVAHLRARIEHGVLQPSGPSSAFPGSLLSGSPRATLAVRRPEPALGLPLALVAGTTAAGIHAAVAPAHLAEQPVSAAFFVVVAAVQLAWVVVASTRVTPVLLVGALVLDGSLIALWGFTRLHSLPFGLLPEPHPVGGWDVACVLWQLVAIAACGRLLGRLRHDGEVPVVPVWSQWHPSTRTAAGIATVVTLLLVATGAHS